MLGNRRFMPLGAQAEVFAVERYAATTRYRVFIGSQGGNLQTSLVNDSVVWSEAAPKQTKGIDTGSLDDKSDKTIIHFTPTSLSNANWEGRRVYILACGAGNTPLRMGQFQTYLTTKSTCRLLAVLMCALFYVLAAFASYQIHRAGQKYPGEGEARGLTGTNYASWLRHFDPVIMTANQNGRGSATKLQIMFFSLLVFGVLAYIWMATGNLSDMSDTVLLLMGISGVGATAAAAAEVSRKRLSFDNWAWLINRKWLPDGGAAEVNRAQWKDIFMTNNEFDVSRFQMITFSVLVGLSLLNAGGATADLSDFAIPTAFLGILGLSQAVYVAGKLVDGPSIEQLDKKITELQKTESALQTALADAGNAGGTPEAPGLRLSRKDLPVEVGKAYDLYMDTWESTRTMFQSTLSESVSAVAQGFRPPFAYLSLPADAMAALQGRYAEVDKRLKSVEDTLAASTAPDKAATAEAIATARAGYATAVAAAQHALVAYVAALQANAGKPSLLPTAVEERAKNIAEAESRARTTLEQLRQSLVKLEGWLPKT